MLDAHITALAAVAVMFYGLHVVVYRERGFAIATRRIARALAFVIDALANVLRVLAKKLR